MEVGAFMELLHLILAVLEILHELQSTEHKQQLEQASL